MGRLFLLVFLADLALIVIALIDCLSTDSSDIRALPKIVWAVLIVLFSPAGPIAWRLAGRPRTTPAGASGAPLGGGFLDGGRSRRQVAPDDDPEFLRTLARQRTDDEELLRQWEADLRRREDDLGKREGDDPPV